MHRFLSPSKVCRQLATRVAGDVSPGVPVVLAATVLIVAAGCGGNVGAQTAGSNGATGSTAPADTGAEPAGAAGRDRPGTRKPFVELFARMGHPEFQPAATRQALADESTAVVVAELIDIRPGRTITSTHSSIVEKRLVHVFAVKRVIKGEGVGSHVHVETDWPGDHPLGDYGASIPQPAPVVLYLHPAATESPGLVIEAGPVPLPGAGELMTPTTPQGYLIELDGEVHTPLLPGPRPEPVFPDEAELHTLAALIPTA